MSLEPKQELVKINEPDVVALKKRYETIQKIKSEILTDEDFVELKGGHKATRKSGWLKYAVAFGLSFEIISERKEADPIDPKRFAYHITVKCTDPTKTRTTEAVGSCTLNEKSTFTTEHIVRAMADTRATERAIIKMLGTNEKAADDLPENAEQEYCKCTGGTNQKDMTKNVCLTCKLPLKPIK